MGPLADTPKFNRRDPTPPFLGTGQRNRFDCRLFFREQAERLTIGIVSREALGPAERRKPMQPALLDRTEIMRGES
jgi:hypothetical protein